MEDERRPLSARIAAGLSQRTVADKTGISQVTLNRILSGKRTAKITEIILIADATGCTVAQLTNSAVADRVLCAARTSNGASMESMHQRLLHLMELEAFLEAQGISVM